MAVAAPGRLRPSPAKIRRARRRHGPPAPHQPWIWPDPSDTGSPHLEESTPSSVLKPAGDREMAAGADGPPASPPSAPFSLASFVPHGKGCSGIRARSSRPWQTTADERDKRRWLRDSPAIAPSPRL